MMELIVDENLVSFKVLEQKNVSSVRWHFFQFQ